MIKLTVSVPPAEISGNARGHTLHKARIVKKVRAEAKTIANITINSLDAEHQKLLPYKSAIVVPTFFHKVKRKRDRDNLTRALKSVIDGLVDAGMIVDDSECIIIPPIKRIDKDNPRVELKVLDSFGSDLIFRLQRRENSETDSTEISFKD